MPELPDIAVYIEALRSRVLGQVVEQVRVFNPFSVRTFDPPFSAVERNTVEGLRRLGKRIVLALSGDLFVVIHLMITGRLLWRKHGAQSPGRIGLAAFDFPSGTLLLTEAGTKKRASIHLLRGEVSLQALDPGGLDVLEAGLEAFAGRLLGENHTLKRALTDPRLFSGIGNAYSDEILHAARLSPVRLTSGLGSEEIERLYHSTREVLQTWTGRLLSEFGDRFPDKGEITAFRPDFAAHGQFEKPCPVCGTPIQRIRHADNETNYCPTCQTGGKLLADRALSRLLKKDWPGSLEEFEERYGS